MYIDTLMILNNALPWNIAVLDIKEIADFQLAREFSAYYINYNGWFDFFIKNEINLEN